MRFSFVMAVVVWVSIGLNLTTLHRHGSLWEEIRPVYGIVQRSLFAAWFGWCGMVGVLLYAALQEKNFLNAQRKISICGLTRLAQFSKTLIIRCMSIYV